MRPPSVTCNRWDVVIVPFPFIDKPTTKRRPALVLSDPAFNQAGYTVMAMITTGANSQWLSDVPVTDLAAAGMPHPCLIRWKVMTLDNRLIERRSGSLSEIDRATADSNFRKYVFS